MQSPYAGHVTAIVPTGSGSIGVHRQLATLLPDYKVIGFPPSLELSPWRLRRLRPGHGGLVHAPPDYSIWVTPPGSALVATFHNYVLDDDMRAHSTLAQRLHYATDLRVFTRRAIRRATAITAVSQATAQLVRDDLGYSGPIRVIPNSVDSHRFSPVEKRTFEGRPRVLFCGTPSRRKGFHWLNAIAKAIDDAADLVCATGSRPIPASDQPYVQHLGSIPHDSMPGLYRSASIFVLPSVREGMSLALLEAMASGLPIVAWRIPSSLELLGDSEGGLLAELGDVDGFAERVRWLLSNPERAADMGDHNRRRVIALHDPTAMAAAYSDVFAGVSPANVSGE